MLPNAVAAVKVYVERAEHPNLDNSQRAKNMRNDTVRNSVFGNTLTSSSRMNSKPFVMLFRAKIMKRCRII